MDTYQAVYDAVRSRLSNGDIGAAVENVMREANIGHHASMVAENIRAVAYDYARPSVLYKPELSLDGNAWIALYGENLQEGVVGCGDSPAVAMSSFDAAWYTKVKP